MPEIIALEPQPAVAVSFTVAYAGLGTALRDLFPDLLRQVKAAGGFPAGPPFTRYLGFAEGGELLIQCGIPVLEAIEVPPPAEAIILPGGSTATLSHSGSFETVPAAHAELDEWFETEGRLPAGPRWESYAAMEGDYLIRLFQPLQVP